MANKYKILHCLTHASNEHDIIFFFSFESSNIKNVSWDIRVWGINYWNSLRNH